jgi:hypothetical protein
LRHHLYPHDDTLYLVRAHCLVDEFHVPLTPTQTLPVLISLPPVHGREVSCRFQAAFGLSSADHLSLIMWALSPCRGFVSARHLGLFGSSLPFLRKGLPESLRIQICSLQSSYFEPTVPPLARRLSVSTSGEEPAALTLFGAMISRAPRSQFLRKSNTPPAPLRQCSKWLPSCLTCGILKLQALASVCPCPFSSGCAQ